MADIFKETISLLNEARSKVNFKANYGLSRDEMEFSIKAMQHQKELMKKSFIFKIEDKASLLLWLTEIEDLKKEERKLPYENIFVSTKITFENYKIMGFLLQQIKEDKDVKDKLIEDGGNEDISISYLMYQHFEDGRNDLQRPMVQYSNLGTGKEFSKYYWVDLGSEEKNKMFSQHLKWFITNFLDWVNNPDVQYIQKVDIPSDRQSVYQKKYNNLSKEIVLTGSVKRYIDNLDIQNHSEYLKSAHWVRGHWRHLMSDMFVKKKGQKIWILPFIRGIGDPNKRDYLVKERENGSA